jgi:hypothetical protein
LPLGPVVAAADAKQRAIVSVLSPDGEFRAVQTNCFPGESGLRLTAEAGAALNVEPGNGAMVGYTPLEDAPAGADRAKSASLKTNGSHAPAQSPGSSTPPPGKPSTSQRGA